MRDTPLAREGRPGAGSGGDAGPADVSLSHLRPPSKIDCAAVAAGGRGKLWSVSLILVCDVARRRTNVC